MKVVIVTMPNVYNCGASLQAYALQSFIESLGFSVSILNYQPKYLKHYRLWRISEKFNKPCIRELYFVVKLPERIRALYSYRKKVFDNFTKSYLNLQKKVYRSNSGLLKANLESDYWVVGSDMVWNPTLPNGKDSSFFLNFPKKGNKLSYAASIASRDFSDSTFKNNLKLLSDFKSISVRETVSVEDLFKYGYSSVAVCDPVFLLQKSFWENLVSDYEEKDQVFLYDFENSKTVVDVANSFKNNVINYFKSDYYFGPKGFVKGILESKVVISNSFHATAFSILFNKEFYAVGRNDLDINLRMQDLLDGVGLSDRFIVDVNDIEKVKEINWNGVNEKLSQIIKLSKGFLTEGLFI